VIAQPVNEFQPGPDSISCPSCGKFYPSKAKICVNCGIDIKTGKAILVSSEVDENVLFGNTESVARILSWFIPIGLYPVASEGYGKHKPYAVWAITALTILITVLVWVGGGSSADGPGAEKSLMMWCGRAPTARDIERGEAMNLFTRWGDAVAFNKKFEEYKSQNLSDDDARVKAYNDLSPDQQFFGTFSLYQLITNGFLHGGVMHLAGNLVFLLVFGSRVNALVGQWRTAVLYPILLIIASTAELISMMGARPTPALGASGAIMGLAGMYFVLFPVHRVYMVIWARLGLLTAFRLKMKIWALRGFWVVLFYIAFDVMATVLGSKDGVAHWAHLGGFIGGAVLGLVLLLTHQIDAMGGDILSAMLGRRAWALLGKPGERQQKLETVAA
jgi:membrane associated rhomboid family serine protease